MSAWYDPNELMAEADGARRQPEFDPEVEEEEHDPVESRLLAWARRMNEIHDIVASQIAPNQTYGPHDIKREVVGS